LERHEPRHPTVDPRVFTTPVPQPKPLPRHGVSRAMVTPSANYDLAHSSLGRVVDDYLSRRVTLFPNCNLIEGVPVVDGFYALSLKEEYQVRALMYARTNQAAPRFMEFMGVSQYTSPTNLFDWQATTNFLPFATVGQQPVYLEAQLAIDVLLGTNWNPRTQLLLAPDQRSAITVTNSARGTVTVQSAQAHRLLLASETAGPSWVVISQSYDPNWRATVDGAPVKVFRGNHAYTALQVPGGKHVIEMEYKDRAFQLGSGLSLAALGFWFFCWFKRPQNPAA
jgi:hypothetical protein